MRPAEAKEEWRIDANTAISYADSNGIEHFRVAMEEYIAATYDIIEIECGKNFQRGDDDVS